MVLYLSSYFAYNKVPEWPWLQKIEFEITRLFVFICLVLFGWLSMASLLPDPLEVVRAKLNVSLVVNGRRRVARDFLRRDGIKPLISVSVVIQLLPTSDNPPIITCTAFYA